MKVGRYFSLSARIVSNRFLLLTFLLLNRFS